MIPANIPYYELIKNNIATNKLPSHALQTLQEPQEYTTPKMSDPFEKIYPNGNVFFNTLDSERLQPEYVDNCDNGLFNEDWTSLLHSAQFASNGKCFTGYVTTPEELEQVFGTFKKVTGTAYSTRVPCCTETFDGIAQEKFLNSLSRPRLFWKMHVGEPHIPYDRVPFMTYGQMAEFPCIYGPKTRKYAGDVKRENKIISLPDAVDCANAKRYKVSCPAHITIRRILRFPDHELVEDSFPGVAALRKAKKQALEDLADAICKGTARPEDRYYISLPTPLAHSNHDHYQSYMTIGSTTSIDPTLSDQICKMLNRGVTTIDQIQGKLYEFVENNLAAHNELSSDDHSFYPHKNDIAKHIYSLYENGKVIDVDLPNRNQDLVDKGLISPVPELHVSNSPNLSYDKIAEESIKYSIYTIVPKIYDASVSREEEFFITTPTSNRMDSESHCSNPGVTEFPVESEPDAIDIESYSDSKPQTNIVQMENGCEDQSPRSLQSPSKSPPTQEAYADTTSKIKMVTFPSHNHNIMSTSSTINASFSSTSSMELPIIDGLQLQPHLENMREAQLASEEVRSLLKLIEYQTYVCKDVECLNSLRRQLTNAATDFSRSMTESEHIAILSQKRSSTSTYSQAPSPKSQKLK